MLNCAATRRSQDKKPDDNKMDVASAGLTNIAEAYELIGRYPDELMLSMMEHAEKLTHTLAKENTDLYDVFTGCGLSDSCISVYEAAAELAEGLTGEPYRRFPWQHGLKQRADSAKLSPRQRRAEPEAVLPEGVTHRLQAHERPPSCRRLRTTPLPLGGIFHFPGFVPARASATRRAMISSRDS